MPSHVVLGRSAGLDDVRIAHVGDEEPPEGIYTDAERVAVRYARTVTLKRTVDDDLYGELARSFSTEQQIELCFVVGLANMVNRFHATFHTDVDDWVLESLQAAACPLPLPAHPEQRSTAA